MIRRFFGIFSYFFDNNSVFSGEFYDDYLQYITLNENPVNFTQLDLKYLLKVSLFDFRLDLIEYKQQSNVCIEFFREIMTDNS